MSGCGQGPARLTVTVAGPRRWGEGGSWRTGVPQPGGRETFCFICKALTQQTRGQPRERSPCCSERGWNTRMGGGVGRHPAGPRQAML